MHAVTKLEWKSPLEIVKYPDPRLRAVNAKIGVFDDSLQALAKEMVKKAIRLPTGCGAAPSPRTGVR